MREPGGTTRGSAAAGSTAKRCPLRRSSGRVRGGTSSTRARQFQKSTRGRRRTESSTDAGSNRRTGIAERGACSFQGSVSEVPCATTYSLQEPFPAVMAHISRALPSSRRLLLARRGSLRKIAVQNLKVAGYGGVLTSRRSADDASNALQPAAEPTGHDVAPADKPPSMPVSCGARATRIGASA